MKASELYSMGKPVYSLEVFPPRNGESMDAILDTLDNLMPFNPAFISITGGALGSLRGGTIAIAAGLKEKYGIECIPHFTCVNKSKQDIENLLMEMKFNEIENVFALRGDPPMGQKEFKPHPQGHRYASELVKQIKLLNEGEYILSSVEKNYKASPTNFGIAVAGYPNGHPECLDRDEDIKHLKIKVDNGADYIVTQLFFDTEVFLEFVENAKKIGIDIPIIPGVMPMDKYGQIKFVSKQMGIEIPKKLNDKLESYKDDNDAIGKILEEHTLSMCKKLMEQGAPGIQFFTMDKPEGTKKILQELCKEEKAMATKSVTGPSDFKSLNRALEIVFSKNYENKNLLEIKAIINDNLKECADKYYNGNVDLLVENELCDLIGIGPVNPEHPRSIYMYVAEKIFKFYQQKTYNQFA